jgi:hypothetical protein
VFARWGGRCGSQRPQRRPERASAYRLPSRLGSPHQQGGTMKLRRETGHNVVVAGLVLVLAIAVTRLLPELGVPLFVGALGRLHRAPLVLAPLGLIDRLPPDVPRTRFPRFGRGGTPRHDEAACARRGRDPRLPRAARPGDARADGGRGGRARGARTRLEDDSLVRSRERGRLRPASRRRRGPVRPRTDAAAGSPALEDRQIRAGLRPRVRA